MFENLLRIACCRYTLKGSTIFINHVMFLGYPPPPIEVIFDEVLYLTSPPLPPFLKMTCKNEI